MARKAKEEKTVLTKKEKDTLSKDIIKEVNEKYKDEIVVKVVTDVKDTIENDYKDELKNRICDELVEDVKTTIKKDLAKLNRSKSFKIFRLYIYILLLIACSVYMIYKLYNYGDLDILDKYFNNRSTNNIKEVIKTDKIPESTTVVKTLEDKIKEYGNLLDNVYVTNYDLLKGDYNLGNISNTDKLAMAYKIVAKNLIEVDGSIYTLSSSSLKDAYEAIFSDNYIPESFVVDGISFAYSNKTDNYIAVSNKEKINNDYIYNKIIDIKETDNGVIISTYVALIKDNKVYSINNQNYKLGEFNDSIDDYIKSLTKVDYVFIKNTNNYKLESITKR